MGCVRVRSGQEELLTLDSRPPTHPALQEPPKNLGWGVNFGAAASALRPYLNLAGMQIRIVSRIRDRLSQGKKVASTPFLLRGKQAVAITFPRRKQSLKLILQFWGPHRKDAATTGITRRFCRLFCFLYFFCSSPDPPIPDWHQHLRAMHCTQRQGQSSSPEAMVWALGFTVVNKFSAPVGSPALAKGTRLHHVLCA